VGLAAVAGDGRLDVSWNAVPPVGADADVAGYRLVLKPGTVPPLSVLDGTPVCDAPSPVQTSCAVTGLTDGQPVSLTVFARDEAANWSAPAPGSALTATPVAPPPPPPPPPPVPAPTVVDHQPPGRPTRVAASLTATGVALSWRNPPDADLDHVEVVRNAKRTPRSPSDGRRTGVGRATHLTFPVRRGEHLHLALYAYDHAGNRSAAAALEVDVPKVLPAAGTSFTHAPQLSWAPVAKAAYYNVVVTRSGKRIAAGWPTATTWRPPKLKPGLYRWYVWPGFGPKSRATYGRLIGSSTFRIR
jgi:hypothetical protein